MRNQQPMPGAVEIFDLDVRGLRQAQAATINATQECASAQVALGADGQKLFDLAHAVEARYPRRAAGTLDAMEQRFDILLEHPAVKGAYRVDGQVDGRRSLLSLGYSVIKPVSNL